MQFSIRSDIFKKPILSFKKALTAISLAAFKIHGEFPPFSIALYARARFLKVSNLAFMGGSIINHGGQNPLEPARLGNYIINGPNIENFREVYEFLIKNNMSQTTSNIIKIQKIIEKKLNKKISNQNKNKIFKIGEKILNENMIYINRYIK